MEIRPIVSSLLRSKTAPLLVAIQVAISLAILANALYIVQLRIAGAARPSGVASERDIGYLRTNPLDKQSHQEILAQQDRELAAVKAVPGVVAASWTSQLPVSRSGSSGSVRASDAQTKESANPALYFAGPGFIETLGLRLVEGRDFRPDEVVETDPEHDTWNESFPHAAIVTRALAERMFPGEQHFVGKNMWFGLGDSHPVRIVGVLDRLQGPQAQNGPEGEFSTIVPWRVSQAYNIYVFRAEPGQRDRVLGLAEQALRRVTARPQRIMQRTIEEDRANRYRNEKALAWMLVAVSGLLLLVTMSGIVGMTSLRVAQRRKQIGVRRALGARWADIMRYFVTENVMITTAGIAAGVLLALGLNQLLISQLELSRLPFGYVAFGAGALWLLGIVSVWGPAARAANTPPAIATRTA